MIFKSIKQTFLLFFFLLSFHASLFSQTDTLIGMVNGKLVKIDRLTGNTVDWLDIIDYPSSYDPTHLTWSHTDNCFYSISFAGVGYATSLIKISVEGNYSVVGEIYVDGGPFSFAESISFNRFDGELYVSASLNGAPPSNWWTESLMRVNPITAEATFVGEFEHYSVVEADADGVTFDDAGDLYCYDGESGSGYSRFYKQEMEFVGDPVTIYDSPYYANSDATVLEGKLYFTANRILRSIDLLTYDYTEIGEMFTPSDYGGELLRGLTWIPDCETEDASFLYDELDYCPDSPAILPAMVVTPGGEFTASPAGLTINGATGEVIPSSSDVGTYAITYTVGEECPSTSTLEINIVEIPVLPVIDDLSFCEADTMVTPIFPVIEGVDIQWFNSNIGIGLPESGIGEFTGASLLSGSAEITYFPLVAGCPVDTLSFTLTVFEYFDASFSYDELDYCPDSPAILPAMVVTPGGEFTASPAGLTINAATGEIIPLSSDVGTYAITYTLGEECPSTSTLEINIVEIPVLPAIDDLSFCEGDTMVTPIFPVIEGVDIQWFNSNIGIGLPESGIGEFTGASLLSGSAEITYFPLVAGCPVDTLSFTLTVFEYFDASFSYDELDYCPDSPAILPAMVVTPGGEFTASPAGLTINAATGEVIPSSSDVGTYAITYTVGEECPSTSTLEINIVEIPVLPAIDDLSFCEADTMVTPIFPIIEGVDIQWFNSNIGIGLPESGIGEFTGASLLSGSAEITYFPLVAGCPVDTLSFTLTVFEYFDASFSYDELDYCPDSPAILPAMVVTPGGEFTASPAGLTINAATGEIIPLSSDVGTYAITYTVGEECPSTSTLEINIVEIPVLPAIDDLSFCEADTMVTPIFPVIEGVDIQWFNSNIGIGLPESGIGEFTGASLLSGSAEITYFPLVAGCPVDTLSFTLTVFEYFDASFSYDELDYCPDSPAILPAMVVTPGGEFTASPAGLNINAATGEIIPSSSDVGTYAITYTVGEECPSTSTLEINIVEIPVLPAIDDLSFCEGDTMVTPVFPVIDGVEIQWTNSNSGIGLVESGIGELPEFIGLPGSAEITYVPVVGDCIGESQSFTINVIPALDISIVGEVVVGCLPIAVTFSSTSLIGWSCLWDLGDGTFLTDCDSITHSYDNIGLYDVSLEVTDENGCNASVTELEIVEVLPQPIAAFSYTSSWIGSNNEVEFINNSDNAVTYAWDFGDGNSSTEIYPIHSYDVFAGYEIVLIAYGDYPGCVDTIKRSITEIDNLIYYVPNAFTPDGDLFNDEFKPVMSSGVDYYDYKLTIFNRWGEILFVSYDYDFGWNGTYLGSLGLVQDGVYVWNLEFGLSGGLNSDKRIIDTGTVTVLK